MANTKARKRAQREALKIVRERNAKASIANKTAANTAKAKETVANAKPSTDITPGPRKDTSKKLSIGGVEKAMGHAADTQKLRQVQSDTKAVRRADTIRGVKNVAKGAGAIGAIAGLGALAANYSKFKEKGSSRAASYGGAGALFNGASPEQAETIARSIEMNEKARKQKKEGKPTAAPAKPAEAKKPAVEAKKPAVEAKKPTTATAEAKPKPKQDNGYPVYKKDSSEASSFRAAFAAARKSGAKEFTWQGRKYNTKIKK